MMKKPIAILTSTIALTSSLISANVGGQNNEIFEPQTPTLHIKGGAWQLFGCNEEIDLKETFNGQNVKVVWTWDNLQENWQAYSTEYAMRAALDEAGYDIKGVIPPNQGFWVMSYEDIDVDVIPFNPIDVNNYQDFYEVAEGEQIDGSIEIFSKQGDDIQVSIKNLSGDIFTVTSPAQNPALFTNEDYNTSDGVVYNFSIYGENAGNSGFSLLVTDISGDRNYTKEFNIGVDVISYNTEEVNSSDSNATAN